MTRHIRLWIFCALIWSCAAGFAQPLQVRRDGAGMRITGAATQASTLQASSDFRTWKDLQTLSSNESINYYDYDAGFLATRFYRLIQTNTTTGSTSTNSVPAPIVPPVIPISPAPSGNLVNLSALPNSVFLPNEGFDTIQFAPSGQLGFIVWKNQELIYRQRETDGRWSEQVISSDGSVFVPSTSSYAQEWQFEPRAVLLFDSGSAPHILKLGGNQILHYSRNSSGQWSQSAISASAAGSSFKYFAAAMGPGNVLHLALVGSETSPSISYGTNRDGSWSWSRVNGMTGSPDGYYHQSYAPRFFSLAVDSRNFAHLTFCPEFGLPRGPEGYLRPYDQLHYANNRNGYWTDDKIMDVADGSGEAGLGASIAIGPDDQPAIASWYDERASTGSSQWSQLLYFHRNNSGVWSQSTVTGAPDGYAAGDGDKGTGFAPYLRFDSQGRAHIIFSDHASQHFSSGQNEYAGQIRHAVLNGNWSFETLYRQTNPLARQMIYPAFALNGSEIVSMGLERQTSWVSPDSRLANSTYVFVFVDRP